MVRLPYRAAALVAAAIALTTAGPAVAQEEDPVLVAQIAQASPTPEPQPPLIDNPDLGGDEEPDEGGNGGSEEEQEASPGTTLPETGAEGAIVALTGLGLLAAGLGLRLAVPDGRRV